MSIKRNVDNKSIITSKNTIDSKVNSVLVNNIVSSFIPSVSKSVCLPGSGDCLAIPTTSANFFTAITNSTLVAGQWYHITDTGDIVLATSSNTYSSVYFGTTGSDSIVDMGERTNGNEVFDIGRRV